MIPKVHTSSDYAGLETENFSFYYGYEIQDVEENWCFAASDKDGNELIRYSSKELNCTSDYPEIGLLKGIGMFLEEELRYIV